MQKPTVVCARSKLGFMVFFSLSRGRFASGIVAFFCLSVSVCQWLSSGSSKLQLRAESMELAGAVMTAHEARVSLRKKLPLR